MKCLPVLIQDATVFQMNLYFPKEAREHTIYAIYERDWGSGPIRLGTTMMPNQDIYALVFAANFRLDVIDKHRWENEKKKEQSDQAFENYFTPEQRKLNAPKEILIAIEQEEA